MRISKSHEFIHSEWTKGMTPHINEWKHDMTGVRRGVWSQEEWTQFISKKQLR